MDLDKNANSPVIGSFANLLRRDIAPVDDRRKRLEESVHGNATRKNVVDYGQL